MVGLTTRQIRNLEAKGLPVRSRKNRKWYPLPDAFRWYLAFREEIAREELEATPYDEALARKTLAEAKIRERELARLDETLVPMVLLDQTLGRVLDRVQARIRNIPGAWSERLVGIDDPRQMLVRLREMVDEVSSDLSDSAEAIVRDPRQEEIPDDFPEAGRLRGSGIELFAELLDMDDPASIRGIGPAKREQIREALESLGVSTESVSW